MRRGQPPNHLSQSRGTKPGEPFPVHAKLHRVGRRRGCVQLAPGKGAAGEATCKPTQPEPAQERSAAHIDASHHELTVLALQVHVARADDSASGDIDNLRVHEVAEQEQLVLRGLRAAVELCGDLTKDDTGPLEIGNVVPRERESLAPPGANDEPRNTRCRAPEPRREVCHDADAHIRRIEDVLSQVVGERQHSRGGLTARH